MLGQAGPCLGQVGAKLGLSWNRVGPSWCKVRQNAQKKSQESQDRTQTAKKPYRESGKTIPGERARGLAVLTRGPSVLQIFAEFAGFGQDLQHGPTQLQP